MNEDRARGHARGEHGDEVDSGAPCNLQRMKPERRAPIQCPVGVMNAVGSPQERHAVAEPVAGKGREIQEDHACDNASDGSVDPRGTEVQGPSQRSHAGDGGPRDGTMQEQCTVHHPRIPARPAGRATALRGNQREECCRGENKERKSAHRSAGFTDHAGKSLTLRTPTPEWFSARPRRVGRASLRGP